jgi:hypothetical protein
MNCDTTQRLCCSQLSQPTCLVVLAFVLSACATPIKSERVTFEGGSIHAPGYLLREEKGGDTSIVTGHFFQPGNGRKITFSFFFPEFAFADPKHLKQQGQKVLWTREGGTGSGQKVTTLAEDKSGERRLYISFWCVETISHT